MPEWLLLLERYEASMTLGAVGDAMGYMNGRWEFCESGPEIHRQLKVLGGIGCLDLSKDGEQNVMVSDDTVLHIHTAEALVSDWGDDKERLYSNLAREYIKGCRDMGGRAPGPTTLNGVDMLDPDSQGGYRIPFNLRGGGCGAAMRACPIGLMFPEREQLKELVTVAVESGRMTHNHPTGFLGAVAAALFVSFALQNKPVREWGAGLLEAVEVARRYVVEEAKVDVDENIQEWSYFLEKWRIYLDERRISNGKTDPIFPDKYGVAERDDFYCSLSYSGWGGASGHDAPMIAYDALLGAGDSWEELCLRGMLHSGDNDSTGIIAGSAWGAMYGFKGVPKCNYEGLEYRDRLSNMASQLFRKAHNIPTLSADLEATHTPPLQQADSPARDNLDKAD